LNARGYFSQRIANPNIVRCRGCGSKVNVGTCRVAVTFLPLFRKL
jgi:hypothetical protein